MTLIVDIIITELPRPPVGTPIILQIRDTSLQDAPATIITEIQGTVDNRQGKKLTSIELSPNMKISGMPPTIWVHVDTNRDGRISKGDFVNVQSYSLPSESGAVIEIEVKRV